jgi:hypothetical protein
LVIVIDGVSCCTELLLADAVDDKGVLLIIVVETCTGALVAVEINGFMGLEAVVVLVLVIEDGLVTNVARICVPIAGRSD